MNAALSADWAEAAAEPRYLRFADNVIGVQFPLMKLAPARSLVAAAPAGAPLIESSSGTMGLALAIVAARLGRPLTLVTPPLTQSLKHHLRALGRTRIVEVRGDQRLRLERLHAILTREPTFHWTEQYSNPLVVAAYRPVGSALAKLGVDAVVAAIGSGGSAKGIIAPLRESRPAARLIAVDLPNSILFGRPDGPRRVPGIGNSLMPPSLDHGLVDTVHWLDDVLWFAEARRLARSEGLFIGPSGAGALKVARWHAKRDPAACYAAILPDEGHRYLETVFVDDQACVAAEPVELEIGDAQCFEPPRNDSPVWIKSDWRRHRLSPPSRNCTHPR
jgi:cysteine synthase A